MDQAVNRRAVRDRTIQVRWSFTAHVEQGTSFTSDSGDEEDLRSLLLDFRSFMAEKEDVFASRILNLLQRGLEHGEWLDEVPKIREGWKQARGHGGLQIVVNGKRLDSEACFNMRVNGALFHQDAGLESEYNALPEMLQALVHQQMVNLVIDGLRVLWVARNIADAALDRGLWKDPDLQE